MSSYIRLAALAPGELISATLPGGGLTALQGRPIYVYQRATSTPVTVYPNSDGSGTPLTQPISSDASGQLPGYVLSGQEIDLLDTVTNTRMQPETLASTDIIGTDGDIGGPGSRPLSPTQIPVVSVDGRTGAVTAQDGDYFGIVATAKAGATAAARFVGATTSGAPASGTFLLGDYVIDETGSVWICVIAGTPGTWEPADGGNVVAKAASYTLLATDKGSVFTFNGSNLTATLPAAAPAKPWSVTIINLGATPLMISPNGRTLNGGAASAELLQNQALTIYSDGSNYQDVAQLMSYAKVTASGTWTIPNGVTQVRVRVTGGGGGGSGGSIETSAEAPGGGGGAGAAVTDQVLALNASDTTLTVTIAAAGGGGAGKASGGAGVGAVGTNGGTTSVVGTQSATAYAGALGGAGAGAPTATVGGAGGLSAYNGAGGVGGSGAGAGAVGYGAAGGGGGSASAGGVSLAVLNTVGGGGGGGSTNAATGGGGGGAATGISVGGSTGSTTAGTLNGNGGAAGANGVTATLPGCGGGGGGGSFTTLSKAGDGGAGAPGLVEIWW